MEFARASDYALQSFASKAALWWAVLSLKDLLDVVWELIGPLLSPELRRLALPAGESRGFLNDCSTCYRVPSKAQLPNKKPKTTQGFKNRNVSAE